MVLRVLDIETTGEDCTKDRVIEIASVDVSPGGIANEMQTFVDPQAPIPPEASAIHHILDEDVAGAPQIREAIGRFEGADWYIAHKAEFEQSFLEPMLGSRWICTYKIALRVWPDYPRHSNQALRYRLGLAAPFGRPRASINPHRALDDCLVTAAIFLKLATYARWADMVRWSAEPALQTTFAWGKHKGARWDAVPEDYLMWIKDKLVDDASAQFSAAYWLDKRSS